MGRAIRWTPWVLVVGAIGALLAVRAWIFEPQVPPAALGQLPEFELVDQDGQAFGLADLRGHVWIANFIFTSCTDVCPRLSMRMREVQSVLEEADDPVLLVSMSVDPTRDTPAKLRQYAARFDADPERWTFLTGPLEDIESTVVGGFKTVMQRTEVDDTGFFNIVHGERFILVDRAGRIRGYYQADDDGLRQLVSHARLLVEAGPTVRSGPA